MERVSSAVATGGNTGGGEDAGGCVVLRACTGAEGGAWGFTFAAAEVEDVSYGPDGRVYFAGTGLPNVAGGLLEHAPGSAPRYYVADASEEGCDVRVCDLGPATGTGDDIRLSHGGTGEVFVAWTQDNRYCARAAARTATRIGYGILSTRLLVLQDDRINWDHGRTGCWSLFVGRL